MQAATVRTHLSSADAHTMPPLNHSPVEADTNVGLIFFNGVMGSGKTKTLIERCARNVRQGVKTAVHVPCFLAGRRKVESRNGTTVDCNVLPHQAKLDDHKVVMIDEAQFISDSEFDVLCVMAKSRRVECYGLLNSYDGTMFHGATLLVGVSAELRLLSKVCACEHLRPATTHVRLLNTSGVPSRTASACAKVEVGGDDKYEAVCLPCWQVVKDRDVSAITGDVDADERVE